MIGPRVSLEQPCAVSEPATAQGVSSSRDPTVLDAAFRTRSQLEETASDQSIWRRRELKIRRGAP
jgi:hypothetical protein